MNPYPSYYLPPDLPRESRPTHLPFIGGRKLRTPCGPDGKEGTYIGMGDYDAKTAGSWDRMPAGWWIRWQGQKPQQLVRLTTSPRIMRWNPIAGHLPGDFWRVPVLLTPMDPNDPTNDDKGYVSALDRVWAGETWEVPPDLKKAQEALLFLIYQVPLAEDLAARTKAVMDLVVQLLSFGHHVSEQEIIQRRWMSELLPVRILAAAIDRKDSLLSAPADEAG